MKIARHKELLEVQNKLHSDPTNITLISKEKSSTETYRMANDNFLSFLHQTAKVHWLEKGDENSKLFHQSIKQRRKHNAIHSIQNANGAWVTTPDKVQDAFLYFYNSLFCSQMTNRTSIDPIIMDSGARLTDEHRTLLHYDFSVDDVKRVLDAIPSNKALELDGYNSHFFKAAWDTIKHDVHAAVAEFFRTGKMLKEINVTSITLVPKVSVPATVGDFRPIACCSVLYKCISKLLCERLGAVLPDIISQNQRAFVAGRSILHNVLICHDIIKMYIKSQVQPNCFLKLDLQKAYDTVE
ncbi:uncharacterized protein [Spinacia oleracea]|uniref:Reverse transcriptase domain-containing protein n=1 Tax=Spinacia oleracea TaxID=3562 RepID=A0A9R0IKS8_SPIOL|nr:uncharacterized protein LOC110790542 [Spinacia oleracea]